MSYTTVFYRGGKASDIEWKDALANYCNGDTVDLDGVWADFRSAVNDLLPSGCLWVPETSELLIDGEDGNAFDRDFVTEFFADDLFDRVDIDSIIEANRWTPRNWFAVLEDADDTDWGTGSFDWDEAVEKAKGYGAEARIAEIDGQYDPDGEPTTDPICVRVYLAGEDF